ncbi:MAG: SLC45 family MFS transporter [Ruminococcaceae bacterium]|nr:SLC45 family MFS transporter [Oscillospiraceae bacterium]
MKLNYKRVVLVGMAFFLISAFWQAYDAIVPLILTNHFGLPQSVSGAVMSIDNVLAVFMLPIFGALSDKVSTKIGKRTPFILVGTLVAVVAFVGLTLVDNWQLASVIVTDIPDLDAAKVLLEETLKGTKDPAVIEALSAQIEQAAAEISQKTLEITLANPLPFVGFIATLLVVLVAMATFRSPAVALMPDVTVKPLRSKANAIINLTGTAGGIIVLGLGALFATAKNHYMQYTWYVVAVVSVMLVGLIVFLLTVREPKWAAEMEADSIRLGLEEAPEESSENKRKLSKPEMISLLLILASVALWYIGYNSITSKYSVYATNILGFDYNLTLIVAQAAAIVAYIPVGIISSKLGRRKTILAGVVMLATAFAIGHFIQPTTPAWIMFPIFSLAGIGWATINVNSFPMVVELARGGDVGKYTGYYYTASMAAQIVAPIVSGVLYDLIGMRHVFFLFGAVFVVFSFITMFFVKHGDAKPAPKKSALEHLDIDD